MTSGYMGCLKRKGFEEVGVDYFYGDADVVTSTKKLRLDPGLPGILEGTQGFGMPCDEMPVEVPQLQQSPELPVVDPEPPPVVSNDEKALVLYKPVNPPMFPGGPAAGSPDLPIKFNANCLANNKAWQFHGMGNMADLFRVSRPSHSMLNPGMSKIADIKDVDNSLAMIPWVPSQFPRPTQEVLAQQKSGCDNGIENNDLMPMEDEDMVSMEEDPIQQTSTTNVIGADGVQWQHCMTAPQPPQNTQAFRQIGNRENDGASMLELHEQLNVEERAIMKQCGLERAVGTRQLVMDRDMLTELVSWWSPNHHVFILRRIGALPLLTIDIRRIMGLSDTGSHAYLDSLRVGGRTKSDAAEYLTGERHVHVPSHGVKVSDILRAVRADRIPRVRATIALTLLYRVSISSNWYNVPCGWCGIIEQCERGERFDWCTLVRSNMIMKLDELRQTGGGDFTYCSILMGWVFNHFPRTAPIRRAPLGPDEPTLRQWIDRHRRGLGGIRERVVRSLALSRMGAQDFVADLYSEIHWESDALYSDDDDGEEHNGGVGAAAPEAGGEEPEPSGASAMSRVRRRRAVEDSVEQVEPEGLVEFRCTGTHIRQRLRLYFPYIRRHRRLERRTPSPEEENVWAEAEIARDVLAEQERRIAELEAQVALQERMIESQQRCLDVFLCRSRRDYSLSRTRTCTRSRGSGTREMSISSTPQHVGGETPRVGRSGMMKVGESSRRVVGESGRTEATTIPGSSGYVS